MVRNHLTKRELSHLVRKCHSFSELARTIGTSARAYWTAVVKDYGIDYSHFTKYGQLLHVGKSHGELTIIKVYRGPSRNGSSRWFCDCTCSCGGFKKRARLDGVINGNVISCGCRARVRLSMRGKGNPAFDGVGEFGSTHFKEIIASANKRGLDFKVTKRYLWGIYTSQKGRCALTGVPITFSGLRKNKTASLDRIDNNKGYVKKNVQWVHKEVNKFRGSLDLGSFLHLCKLVCSWNRKSPIQKADQ